MKTTTNFSSEQCQRTEVKNIGWRKGKQTLEYRWRPGRGGDIE
jgi:hypothetical protein